ncbi:MAG: Gordonia phage Guacamole [Actinomycetota bacterium]
MRRARHRSTSVRRRRTPARRTAGQLSALERSRITCAMSAWRGESGRCQWCNERIDSPRRRTWCSNTCGRAWQRHHIWRFARAAAKRRAKYYCQRPGCTAQRRDCEVNHKAARNGGGYGPGCHHHLDPDQNGLGGLEVLCRAHHREITTAQSKERAAQRRAAREKAAATDSSSSTAR